MSISNSSSSTPSTSTPSTFSTSSCVEKWKPKTLAGRIVKPGDVTNIKQLRRLKLEIREPKIVYTLLPDLKEEVLKVTNIGQGQYQREAFVIVGDGQGLIGLGKRCGSNDREAIVGAKRNARLSKRSSAEQNGTQGRDRKLCERHSEAGALC